MNPDNHCRLRGTVVGDCWSRWPVRARGRVYFWLAVSRSLAGDGTNRLLCAIEPNAADEVYRLEREIHDGRSITIDAAACQARDEVSESMPGVVFVAECCGLDGAPTRSAHNVGIAPRRNHAHGKAAAAGDDQSELLPIGEVKS